MANYVYNKIICSKDTLDCYFIDYNSFEFEEPLKDPYIGFRKIYETIEADELKSREKEDIYYGYGFSYKCINDAWEIKFATRWCYPIVAIIQAISLNHNLVWYAMEENTIFISRFSWNNGIKEEVTFLDDKFYEWLDDADLSIEDDDNYIWHYPEVNDLKWQEWPSNDNFKRYDDLVVNIDLSEVLNKDYKRECCYNKLYEDVYRELQEYLDLWDHGVFTKKDQMIPVVKLSKGEDTRTLIVEYCDDLGGNNVIDREWFFSYQNTSHEVCKKILNKFSSKRFKKNLINKIKDLFN